MPTQICNACCVPVDLNGFARSFGGRPGALAFGVANGIVTCQANSLPASALSMFDTYTCNQHNQSSIESEFQWLS